MLEADIKCMSYMNCVESGQPSDDVHVAALSYSTARNRLTTNVIREQSREWLAMIDRKSDREIWKKNDWNGSHNRTEPADPPSNDEVALHFEELYSSPVGDSVEEIVSLNTDVNIPILDNAISEDKIVRATQLMKKCVFDFAPYVLKSLISSIMPNLADLSCAHEYVVLCAIPCYVGHSCTKCNTKERQS
jgi:hypothetical protein